MPDTPRRRALLAASLLGAMLIAVTGCASHADTTHPATGRRVSPARTSSTTGPSAASSQTADYGRSARALAAAVPGCAARPISRAAAKGDGLVAARTVFAHARSAVSCSLQGRSAVLLTFDNPAAQAAAQDPLYPRLAFYAAGAGWVVVPLDVSEPVGEQSIVQDFALALAGHIVIGAKAPRAPRS